MSYSIKNTANGYPGYSMPTSYGNNMNYGNYRNRNPRIRDNQNYPLASLSIGAGYPVNRIMDDVSSNPVYAAQLEYERFIKSLKKETKPYKKEAVVSDIKDIHIMKLTDSIKFSFSDMGSFLSSAIGGIGSCGIGKGKNN